MSYSIYNYSFLGLESAAGRGGAPLLPHEMIELVQRDGVNGTGFILRGSKGFAFPARSWVDVASEAAAHTLMVGYRTLVGTGLYDVTFRSVSYGTVHNVYYGVIGVTEDRIETMANMTGGLNVSNGSVGGVLHVIWHLVPVYVEP